MRIHCLFILTLLIFAGCYAEKEKIITVTGATYTRVELKGLAGWQLWKDKRGLIWGEAIRKADGTIVNMTHCQANGYNDGICNGGRFLKDLKEREVNPKNPLYTFKEGYCKHLERLYREKTGNNILIIRLPSQKDFHLLRKDLGYDDDDNYSPISELDLDDEVFFWTSHVHSSYYSDVAAVFVGIWGTFEYADRTSASEEAAVRCVGEL